MGSKYSIRCARYPFKGYYEDSWQGNNVVSFLLNLVKSMRLYEIVDVEFRALERMDAIDEGVLAMDMNDKSIYVKCDCRCCTLEVGKITWDNGDVDYCISVLDSRYDHDANGVWNRIKRAAKALFGKPVYFNDVSLSQERYEKLLEDMAALKEWEGDE